MINKTISLACYSRPKILLEALDSLKNQMADLANYKLYISCEPGNSEVINIIKNIDFIETDITINDKKLGLSTNTFNAINKAFKQADFNLYLEDDIVLSPDALNLFEWYIKQDLTNIVALSFCNFWDKNDKLDENLIYKVRGLNGWGFIASKQQFKKYFRPFWFPLKGFWDKSSAIQTRKMSKNIYYIVPQLSRSTNIGDVGTNMTTGDWKRFMGGHIFNTKRKIFNYYLKGELTFK